MTYTVRIPGQTEPIQMELAKLKNAYADRNIPGSALVTLEHQDFWYSLAELMGDKPSKPLLFPCPQCKQMIRARAIDRGNPVVCPKCQAKVSVANPVAIQAKAAATTDRRRGKPLFVMGLLTAIMGVGMLLYPLLFPSPEALVGKGTFVVIGLGVAMMTGTRFMPKRWPYEE